MVKYFDDCENDDKKKHSDDFSANENTLKLTIQDKEFVLTDKHISFKDEQRTQMEEKYVPHVIEPSFGIGRIIYCIFEHCFNVREKDAQRTYFDFPAEIAPLSCSLLPLINNSDLNKKVHEIKRMLIKNGVTSKVDESGVSVGKRYARTDECGIPYAITVDFETLEQNSVTLRQLDTMKQIRLPIQDLALLLNKLKQGTTTWAESVEQYGLVQPPKEEEDK